MIDDLDEFKRRVAHIVEANRDSTQDAEASDVLKIMESGFSTSLAMAFAGYPVDEYLHIVEVLADAIQAHAERRFRHVHTQIKAGYELDS